MNSRQNGNRQYTSHGLDLPALSIAPGAIRSASHCRSNRNKNATDFTDSTDSNSLAYCTFEPERPDREIHNKSVESVKSVAFLFFDQFSLKAAEENL
jgi:hypothetical protein